MAKYVDGDGLKRFHSRIAEVYPTATEVDEAIDLAVAAGVTGLAKAISVVEWDGSSYTPAQLKPNVWNRFTTAITSILVISFLAADDETIYNEWMFEFKTGSTAPTFTMPSSVIWANGEAPVIEANKTYHVSIVNNLATIVGFPNA